MDGDNKYPNQNYLWQRVVDNKTALTMSTVHYLLKQLYENW